MLVKLADLVVFSDQPRILYVDSDVLFVKEPTFLRQQLSNAGGPHLFNRDVKTSYITSPEEIEVLTGCRPISDINAGLSLLHRADLSLNRITAVLSDLAVDRRTNWAAYSHLLEQTAIAVLTTSSARGAALLPDEYNVSHKAAVDRNVSQHYVGVIRHQYELQGLKFLLEKQRFLARWDKFARSY